MNRREFLNILKIAGPGGLAFGVSLGYFNRIIERTAVVIIDMQEKARQVHSIDEVLADFKEYSPETHLVMKLYVNSLSEKEQDNLCVKMADRLNLINKEEQDDLIKNQLLVLDYCKKEGLPVYIIETKEDLPTIKKLTDKIAECKRGDLNPIYKNEGKEVETVFEETDLNARLNTKDVKYIIPTGIFTTECVKSFVRGAIGKYIVLFSPKLTADLPEKYVDLSYYKTWTIYREDPQDLLDIISENRLKEETKNIAVIKALDSMFQE